MCGGGYDVRGIQKKKEGTAQATAVSTTHDEKHKISRYF